jgi:NADPH:quinone reductase-like Zn-dependent oxidoreductase
LVNGASGDVGTFAAKIAHTFGAEVTGVCSIRNLELVFQLGATRVIDYTRENFTKTIPRTRYETSISTPLATQRYLFSPLS